MKLRKRSIGIAISVVAIALVATAVVATTVLINGISQKTGTSTTTPSTTSSNVTRLSRDQAGALLNAVPGFSNASVGEVISGLSTQVVIEVYVNDDTAITKTGVLDYVLRVGWATAFDSQPAELTLTVRNNGRTLDLQQQANALAGVEYPAQTGVNSVYLNGPTYMGAWPGAVPVPPAS